MKKCKICERKIDSDEFCEYHQLAKENINKKYDYWQKAYDGISLKDYLIKLAEHENSGKWVKEMAKYLLKNEKF